jgi:GH25 family lysozyme M1 (1,4-beta-N-acetylmuramidase)
VDRFARRIADAEGQLAADTLILRPLPGGSRRRPIEQAAPAAAVVAPPAAVANWRLGVDFSSYQNVHDAGFENLRSHQKVFAILKSSQGQVRDGKFLADPHDVAHSDYYAKARAHGFIRGSYHFLANKRGLHSLTFSGTIEQQVNMVKSTVPPLLPGDLTPALDLEDQENHGRFPLDQGVFPDEHGYHYRTHWPTHAAGRRELLTDIQDFLDRIETAYGRTPIIYTSIMWADTDDMDNPPDLDPDYPLSNYPLWNVYHARRDDHGVLIPIDQISAGGWGPNWTFVQYAEQGHQWWGMANYREPGINIPGLDFDAFRNSLYELRGLADIGRLGVAFLGAAPFIAFADLDNHLHVRPEPTSAAGQDLTGLLPGSSNDTAQPRISGDPVLLASPNAFYLYFRGGDHLVEASAPFANQLRWRAIDIEDTVNNTPVKPLHDPRAAILGNRRYIVYVGDDLDWHLVVCSETGRRSWSGILTSAGLPARRTAGQPTIQATGQPTVYISATIIHLVGRVYQDGQLFYLTFDGTNWSPPEDITLGVQHLAPTLYAATCSPCIFETTRGLAVVYRAVRGDLWVVPRGGDAPVNLMVATRTPAAGRASAASGHPTCFVLRDIPHVVYRGVDGQIRDMWLDAGNWQVRLLCPGDANKAAADPVATANGTTAYVVYRGTDEQIHTASFDGTTWTCNTTGN